MRKKLLVMAAVMTGVAAQSVVFLTEFGTPARKGVVETVNTTTPNPVSINKAPGNLTLPYYQTFDSQESLNEVTTVTNNSSKNWTWIASCPTFNESCLKVETNFYSGLKAYVVLPAAQLEAGKYVFDFDAWGQSSFNKEYITACYATGNTLSDLSAGTVLVPTTELSGYCYIPSDGKQEKQHFSCEVDIPASGTYYFAVGTAKDGSGMAVFVDNLSLSAAVTATAPGAVTDIEVVPDAAGALSAKVSATAPTTDVTGAALTNLDGLKIYRGSDLVATLPATPGETVSCTDTPAAPGNYLYRAIAFNNGGDGEATTATAFVGHSAPGAPEAFYAYRGENTRQIVVEWSTPLDIYGKTFAPGQITYSASVTRPNQIDWFDPMFSDIAENSYIYNVPEFEGDQTFLRFSFSAKNLYGQESAKCFPDVRIPVGTPYTVPFKESFEGGALSYLFRTKMEGNFGLWGLSDDEIYAGSGLSAQDGDNGFIVYAGMEDGDAAGLYSGIIDLAGVENPALSFYYYGQTTANELQAFVKADKDFVALGEPIVMSDGNDCEWNHVIYSMLPYSGKHIEVALRARSHENGMIAVDNLSVFNQYSYDLTVNLSAPAKVSLGQVIPLIATVTNMGARAAEGYKVAFYCGDKKFDAVDGPKLENGADAKVETTYLATIPLGERAYRFHAEIEYDADEEPANNTSNSVETRAVKSIHPAPANLTGSLDGTTVTLTWEAPDTDTEVTLPVTEGFENAESWATATASDWTFVDGDRGPSGYFQDFELPAITGGEPASWFVLDGSDENCRYYGLTPHTGTKCLAVLYNAQGIQNDDWAISPKLSGDAQTVSFFARSYSSSYPDDFEVLYSSASANPSDFKPISGASYSQVSSSWTEYVVKLPAGAKYFAIHYNSTDAFCLLVDDITFIPADGEKPSYSLRGYNVYRNGVALNDMPVENTTFAIDNISTDEANDFHVTAVYRRYGESAPSNVFTVGLSGIETVTAADVRAEYFDLSGIAVSSPQRGRVYIVRRGAEVTKELIR